MLTKDQFATARILREHREKKLIKERVYCSMLVDFAVNFSHDSEFDEWEFWRAAGYKFTKTPAHRYNVLSKARDEMRIMNSDSYDDPWALGL